MHTIFDATKPRCAVNHVPGPAALYFYRSVRTNPRHPVFVFELIISRIASRMKLIKAIVIVTSGIPTINITSGNLHSDKNYSRPARSRFMGHRIISYYSGPELITKFKATDRNDFGGLYREKILILL